jgi:hypothetical protein
MPVEDLMDYYAKLHSTLASAGIPVPDAFSPVQEAPASKLPAASPGEPESKRNDDVVSLSGSSGRCSLGLSMFPGTALCFIMMLIRNAGGRPCEIPGGLEKAGCPHRWSRIGG